MKLDLSVRTISAGTGIPPISVQRAKRAIARAEAKKPGRRRRCDFATSERR
jgi:hypothetical protein